MKLTTKIKVATYRVLASYKKKTENQPLLAVLELVKECQGYSIQLDAAYLQEQLMNPLPKQACMNLLQRLVKMGYLKKIEVEDEYEWNDFVGDYRLVNNADQTHFALTALGEIAIQQEVFYEPRKGELEITLTKHTDFVNQPIIKIKEVDPRAANDTKEKKPHRTPQELAKLAHSETIYELKSSAYLLGDLERKCVKVESKEEEVLTIEIDEDGARVFVQDYEHYDQTYQLNKVRVELLGNEFDRLYQPVQDRVLLPFDKTDLTFERKHQLQKPRLSQTTFDSISLPIKVSPKDHPAAEQWHWELVYQGVQNRADYFWSAEEFEAFAEEKVALFEEEYRISLTNSIQWDRFVSQLEKRPKSFYTIAKLNTFQYLNY